MSLQFEYRRLAAACLDLSQRAAALADKTRLLLIAEAWFELADRVSQKVANPKPQNDGSAEDPPVRQALDSSATAASFPARIDSGMQ